MAREYGKILTRIWGDQAFKALNGDAQRLYFQLISQPDLSMAGVLTLAEKRWSLQVGDCSEECISQAVEALEVDRFVVVDRGTQELLVRSFIRSDGGWKSPTTVKGIASSIRSVLSDRLKATLRDELLKLDTSRLSSTVSEKTGHSTRGFVEDIIRGIADEYGDLSAHPSDTPCDAPSDRSPVRATEPEHAPEPAPAPENEPAPETAEGVQGEVVRSEPSSVAPPSRPPSVGRRKPARPIPADWSPTEAHQAKASELGLNIHSEGDEFVNWALSGDERKADWDAAFRNWLTRSAKWKRERPSGRPSQSRAQQREESNLRVLAEFVRGGEPGQAGGQEIIPFPGGGPA